MSWYSNQFFHADEITQRINSARTIFNNTDPKSYTEEEKIFIPGTAVKIPIVFKGKQIYISGVICVCRDIGGNSYDIIVAVYLGNEIYTEFCFKTTDVLILDPEGAINFDTYVTINKERLNELA